MITSLLTSKLFLVTPPAAVIDNAAVATNSIDTDGFDWVDIYVIFGAMDIAMATLKLQHSDTDSAYADMTNGSFATGTLPDGTAATLPSATSDNTVFAWHGKPSKRYLDVAATAGDGAVGTYVTIVAFLSRPRELPNTTAKRGLAQELLV